MSEIFEFLSYSFTHRALLAGSFIAITCSILGVQLVLRRMSLIGDGLAHVTFSGIALGLLFGLYPLYIAIPVVILSSIGILKLIEKVKLYGDSAIGIVSSLGVAGGVILTSIAGGFNVDLLSFLFGNILAVSIVDVFISIALTILILIFISLYYNEIFSVTFDEEFAKTSGINTKKINTTLVVMTAVTVVLAMKIVGIMLTSAFLILPAVSAFQIAKSFKNSLLLSSLISVISVILGIFTSFFLNLPSGACIILLNFILFCLIFVFRHYSNLLSGM
jgi:zinc transport system permease protein